MESTEELYEPGDSALELLRRQGLQQAASEDSFQIAASTYLVRLKEQYDDDDESWNRKYRL